MFFLYEIYDLIKVKSSIEFMILEKIKNRTFHIRFSFKIIYEIYVFNLKI